MSGLGRIEAAILEALALEGARPGSPVGLSGAEISRAVEKLSGGALRVPPGGLYTTLTRLSDLPQRKGFITASVSIEDHRKVKRYRLTARGEANMPARVAQVDADWTAGTTGIHGQFAEYALGDRFNFQGRGEMYHARVTRVLNAAELPAWCTEGTPVVIKCLSPRLPSAFGQEQASKETLAQYIAVVNEALAGEFDSLRRLNHLDRVAATLDWGERVVHLDDALTLKVRFLVQERINGVPLHRYLERLAPASATPVPGAPPVAPSADAPAPAPFAGLTNPDHWFELAEALATGLKQVHNTGTFHRDIWLKNVVVKTEGAVPEFVYGDLGDAVFRKASSIRLPNEHEARPYIAPEQRGQPLQPSRRADIYALGAILFFAATGEPPSLEGMTNEDALKAAVFDRLLAVPNGVLLKNFGIADIISRCLRVDVDARVGSANALLQDIRVFRQQRDWRPTLAGTADEVSQLIAPLMAGPEVFKSLAAVELAELEDRLQAMRNGDVVVEGSHDGIVLKLTTYLSTLGPGDEYLAVTVPQFWSRKNLGVRGRYLSMNLELARRGVKIRRVFLLTEADRRRLETQAVIRAQLEFRRLFLDVAELSHAGGVFDTRYRVLSDKEIERIVTLGDQKGVWISGDSAVELTPVYDSLGQIRLMTIRRAPEMLKVREWFKKYARDSQPLVENWAL